MYVLIQHLLLQVFSLNSLQNEPVFEKQGKRNHLRKKKEKKTL